MNTIIIGLTILAIFLLGYFFILYNQRKVILDKVKQNESDYEKKSKFANGVNDSMEGMGLLQAVGLEASTPLEEANQNIQQLRKTSSSQIQSMPDKYRDLALREVTIKSSFNSAISGNFASSEQIKNVLQRGCRFLDFQILTSETDAKDYVSMTLENQSFNLDTENKLPLAEAMNTASSYGFSKAPNSNDPLFIHLRIATTNPDSLKRIQKIIGFSFSGRLFTGLVNQSTPLGDLKGKAVIIVDLATNPELRSIGMEAHIFSGTTDFRKYEFQQLQSMAPMVVQKDSDSLHNDMGFLRMCVPLNSVDVDVSPNQFLANHPCQVLAMRFYKIDENLIEYENLFNKTKSAFLPLPVHPVE